MPTIIFKASEKCNSNCIYCDVVVRKAPKIMPLNLLELVFSRLNEYLDAFPEETMHLIWHGGEPCTLGVDYFKKAREFQDKYCPQTKSRIIHDVQSNLTMITQEFIDIFKELGIKMIGTSYEPVPGLRGFGKNRDSEAYNRSFMNGINLLDRNNMGWGFIYVTTRHSLNRPLDIFYFLSNLKPGGGFTIHPVLLYNNEDRHNLGITPAEYADFLGVIFPVWYRHRDRYANVEPFQSILDNYTKSPTHLCCSESGACAYSHAYIGPSGNASHCGRAADWDLISYGNIKDRSLIDIFKDERREPFVKRAELLPGTDCKNCSFWEICHGGCPLDAYNKHKDFLRRTEWCDVNKIFLTTYFEPVTGLKADFKSKPVESNG